MKLTNAQLKQIIKEELRSVLEEEPIEINYSSDELKIAKMIMGNIGTVEQAKQFIIMSKDGIIPPVNILNIAQIIADELAKLEEPDSWLNKLYKEWNTLTGQYDSQDQALVTKVRNLGQHIRSSRADVEDPIVEFQGWLEDAAHSLIDNAQDKEEIEAAYAAQNEAEEFKWIIGRGEYRLMRFYNDFHDPSGGYYE